MKPCYFQVTHSNYINFTEIVFAKRLLFYNQPYGHILPWTLFTKRTYTAADYVSQRKTGLLSQFQNAARTKFSAGPIIASQSKTHTMKVCFFRPRFLLRGLALIMQEKAFTSSESSSVTRTFAAAGLSSRSFATRYPAIDQV